MWRCFPFKRLVAPCLRMLWSELGRAKSGVDAERSSSPGGSWWCRVIREPNQCERIRWLRVSGVRDQTIVNYTGPSLNLIQRNLPQSNVT